MSKGIIRNNMDNIFLIIETENPEKSIYIGECKQGMPCKHCFSNNSGKTFSTQFGHDIYKYILSTIEPEILAKLKTSVNFKHLRGMYTANTLLKYKLPVHIE